MGSTSEEEDEGHEPIKDKDITTHQPPLANDKEKVVRPINECVSTTTNT